MIRITERRLRVSIENRSIGAFTYEVRMIIQILAENEKEAKERLDRDGGMISFRSVQLKDSVPLFSGAEMPTDPIEGDEDEDE